MANANNNQNPVNPTTSGTPQAQTPQPFVNQEIVGDVTCKTSIEEAKMLMDIAARQGLKTTATMAPDMSSVTVTIADVSDTQLVALERKVRIGTWSKNVTGAMTKVSNFMSDTADFALNGAIAPAAIATGEAAARIVNVGGRAAVKTVAGLANSIAINGTQMVLDLTNDPTIQDTKATFKNIGTMLGNKLFGASSIGRFQRVPQQTTATVSAP